jgi:hypothetical protein
MRLCRDLAWRAACRAWPAALLWGLTGCSPALDWRVADVDGLPVSALLPCKPERGARDVPLAGPAQPPVRLHMLSCEAAGRTFAVAAVAVPPPAGERVASWADTWLRAQWASVGVQAPGEGWPAGWQRVPCGVRGAQWSLCLRGPARGANGQTLPAEWHWASGGPWLVQLATYGPPLSPTDHETYFGGLSWR